MVYSVIVRDAEQLLLREKNVAGDTYRALQAPSSTVSVQVTLLKLLALCVCSAVYWYGKVRVVTGHPVFFH